MGSRISQRGYMSIEGSGRARREGSSGLRFMEEVRRKRRREVSANRPKGTGRAGEMRKSSSLSRAQIGALAVDPAVTIVTLDHHAAFRLRAEQTGYGGIGNGSRWGRG